VKGVFEMEHEQHGCVFFFENEEVNKTNLE